MKYILIVLISILAFPVIAQDKNFEETELSVSRMIDGTLLTPLNSTNPNLAIIIAGSGPTDRNGNQNFAKNNSLKQIAESLSNAGIATFRYDKRVVKQIKIGKLDKRIMFDDFVDDAIDVLTYFKSQEVYSNIYMIGHSQGSLVGMLASPKGADGFISLAGAGQNIGDVLVEQVTKTAPQFTEETQSVVNKLKKGKTTNDYPAALESIFNKELQPFMINWMSYSPTEELQKLNIPILIVNGTKDLQVSVNEAELLANANKKATLKIIDNMNHVLFLIDGNDLENSKSNNESWRKVSPELIASLIDFIKS
ncbi:MAG: alpha/beta hydrolase [Winogradskyella sp.]|nr:lysophospholipase [Winogradskyella sp.]MBT8377544.1 lysophospholipase [Bacteroidia bacterium]NNC45225.1 alpha/beta hydrolase [Winogradskyella sp.]NNF85238.1 alpha/beta hydrolase [Winogradskyella sp.]NNK40530.1 alpha/beta hydrolase [Winogradskyella sp.]